MARPIPLARPGVRGRRVGLTVTGWLLALVVGVLATAYGEGPAVGLAAVGAVVLGAWWVRRRTR
jgi:Flp pilus assembly protein TadB